MEADCKECGVNTVVCSIFLLLVHSIVLHNVLHNRAMIHTTVSVVQANISDCRSSEDDML